MGAAETLEESGKVLHDVEMRRGTLPTFLTLLVPRDSSRSVICIESLQSAGMGVATENTKV